MDAAIAALGSTTRTWLKESVAGLADYTEANEVILKRSGIQQFFRHQEDFRFFRYLLQTNPRVIRQDSMRRDYGDFQTPRQLTDRICAYLHAQGRSPEILIEPTFGTGAFILSALQHFPSIRRIYGVEIHEPYYWKTKYTLLGQARHALKGDVPQIFLSLENVFHYNFIDLASSLTGQQVLVLGNPPWVTNTELSKMRSTNIPKKCNVNALTGIEALTGKSNFDLSENILRMMVEAFSNCRGSMGMLVKQTVIKNLIYALPATQYPLQQMKAFRIDAKKHFDASVEAMLFEADFQAKAPEMICQMRTFSGPTDSGHEFGWVGRHFVADARCYRHVHQYDSPSPYVWRQGVKHDCAKVMEIQPVNGTYVNGFREHVDLEPEILYGLLKSSDLKQPVTPTPRKYVIVTQRALGENTAYLAESYPKTYQYLCCHQDLLERRKSIVYKGKPAFSIFGIGAYAFAPYKVAISGLYKRPVFTLIVPIGGKPLMLDDTCYYIGFAEFSEAIFVWAVLNGERVRTLLSSITFVQEKRPYTKQQLMRIGIDLLAAEMNYHDMLERIRTIDDNLVQHVTESQWHAFVRKIVSHEH